jgi:nitrite reductase/ring-hydroxylating ferredoxin subunit
MPDALPSRRSLVTGLAAGGLALPLLAACGSTVTGTTAGASATPGTTLATTAEIPVGGGKILDAQQIVVTQPASGEFKAFSAVCTHQQCLVTQIADGVIHCPCHGSEFSIKDGSVVGGPAPAPLPSESITVKKGEIRLV